MLISAPLSQTPSIHWSPFDGGKGTELVGSEERKRNTAQYGLLPTPGLYFLALPHAPSDPYRNLVHLLLYIVHRSLFLLLSLETRAGGHEFSDGRCLLQVL